MPFWTPQPTLCYSCQHLDNNVVVVDVVVVVVVAVVVVVVNVVNVLRLSTSGNPRDVWPVKYSSKGNTSDPDAYTAG